jgi:hypothetical protein
MDEFISTRAGPLLYLSSTGAVNSVYGTSQTYVNAGHNRRFDQVIARGFSTFHDKSKRLWPSTK